MGKLSSRSNAGLGEHVAQVERDRARGDPAPAATSLLGRPWATSWAMRSSVGVSSTDQEDHVRRYIAFLRPFNDTTQGQEKPS